MTNNKSSAVTYEPPEPSLIEYFSHEVCQQLGDKIDTGYNRPEVINGLAEYLKFTSQLIAKCVNAGHYELLDK